MLTRKAALRGWLQGVCAATWMAVGATGWAQTAAPPPTADALPDEAVPEAWTEAAREAGTPAPIAVVERFRLGERTIAVLAGSELVETGQREHSLAVVAQAPDGTVTVAALPRVRTLDRPTAALASARLMTTEGSPPLLVVDLELPSAERESERRSWVVDLDDVSLLYDFLAREWREEHDGTWTRFDRELRYLPTDEGGHELALFAQRRNADGRASVTRMTVRTWP